MTIVGIIYYYLLRFLVNNSLIYFSTLSNIISNIYFRAKIYKNKNGEKIE